MSRRGRVRVLAIAMCASAVIALGDGSACASLSVVKTKMGKFGSQRVHACHAKDSVHLVGYPKWKSFSVK